MPQIKLEHINKRWGKIYGVEDLNLQIDDNAFVTLLGPSGCGKTTVLRMIAGLETPTTGRITIGDTVVFDSSKGINIPTSERKVGFLFQNYALWPNMTVYNNISYGLTEIKTELSLIDFEAKNYVKLATIIANPSEVRQIISECMDASGAFEYDRAIIKLIDKYEISQYLAKQVLAYDYNTARDFTPEVRELMGKADLLIAKNHLNENFEYLDQNGDVLKVIRKYTKEEIDLTVRYVSRLLKISTLMDRYPSELSGGQQQRVSIARTLAPEPSILFMDEPLSNLDPKLRLEMKYELQRLHVETGATFIYVTHDQEEAMSLSSKICLLNNGFLQQFDSPITIYNQPNNTFVADFIGDPAINFIEAKGHQNSNGEIELTVLDGNYLIYKPKVPFNLNEWLNSRSGIKYNSSAINSNTNSNAGIVSSLNRSSERKNRNEVFKYQIYRVNEIEKSTDSLEITDEDLLLAVRPEYVIISDAGRFEGEIYSSMPTGIDLTLRIRFGNYLLTSLVFGNQNSEIGTKVKFDFSSDNLILFDRRTGKYISLGSVSDLKPEYVSVSDSPNIVYVDRIVEKVVEKEVEKIVYVPKEEEKKEETKEEIKDETKEETKEEKPVIIEEVEEEKKDDKPKRKPPVSANRKPRAPRRLPRRTSTVEVEPGYWLDRHEFNSKIGM